MNEVTKMVEGSPLWQQIFLGGALLFIILQMVSGWKLGPMRMLTNICALVAAYAAAYFGGPFTVPVLRGFLTFPDIILRVLGGVIVGVLAYLVCSLVGSILFKKTRDQESTAVRAIYGVSGSILGIVSACFLLWLAVLGVRLLGTVGETQIVAQRQAQTELGQASPGVEEDPTAAKPSVVGTFAARLKNSIELGVGEAVVDRVDVVPDVVYRVLDKLTRIVANPVSVSRFLAYPGAAELSNHPKIQELKNDTEIQKLVEEGRYLDMMRNEKIIDAANDPDLGNRLRKFELEKAMDFALQRGATAGNQPSGPLRHTPLR